MASAHQGAAAPRANILLVDDQPANLVALEAVLGDLGQNLVRAGSGPDALKRVLEHDFAVILMDVRMPDMDGYEAARLIRGREKSRHTPIIFITAHDATDSVVLKSYREGGADYLVKPFVPEVLRAKVARFVELYQKTELIRELQGREYENRLAEEKQRWELERLQKKLAEESREAEALAKQAHHLTRLSARLQQEIDERMRTETELRESEASFRHLADSMPQIVWAARPDGHLDYYNRRWYEYTGFTEEESLAPGGWKTVLHPDDVPLVADKWNEAIRSGEPFQIECRFKDCTTGGYRWHLGRALPVCDGRRSVVRWYGTCTDIDDLKRFQEALQAADRHKDEFLAMLAHELRNPLAPISNALHILRGTDRDGSLADKTRRMMERQVGQLVRLVDDLVDVSRLTHGQIQLRTEPVCLDDVVGRAVETVRPLIDGRRHTLTVTLPPEPVRLDADPVRIVQVVANLLSNAAKYTDEGGRISVSAAAEGGELALQVKDNGRGMSAALLPRVFDLFQQGERTLDRTEGGLGIGLTLVRRLVEMHGGRVEALSAGPGQGSEFVVRLPLRTTDEGGRMKGETNGSLLTADPASAPSCRVLVVDDNQDGAGTLAMLLKVWGHDYRLAHDGLTALKTADSFRPDVVLLDIGLPGMDGYEVARRLREDAGLRDAYVVAVTGYGQDEDRRRARECGFDHHLVKPVDPAALEQLLAYLASRRPEPVVAGGAT